MKIRLVQLVGERHGLIYATKDRSRVIAISCEKEVRDSYTVEGATRPPIDEYAQAHIDALDPPAAKDQEWIGVGAFSGPLYDTTTGSLAPGDVCLEPTEIRCVLPLQEGESEGQEIFFSLTTYILVVERDGTRSLHPQPKSGWTILRDELKRV